MRFNDYRDTDEVNRGFDGMKHQRGFTYTDKALQLAERDVFQTSNGMRINVPKVSNLKYLLLGTEVLFLRWPILITPWRSMLRYSVRPFQLQSLVENSDLYLVRIPRLRCQGTKQLRTTMKTLVWTNFKGWNRREPLSLIHCCFNIFHWASLSLTQCLSHLVAAVLPFIDEYTIKHF